MRGPKTFLLLLPLLVAASLKGQTPITLQDALGYALKNSEVVRQAKLDIEKATQVVHENRAAAYPQIGVTSQVTGNPIVAQFVLPAEALGGAPGEYMGIKMGQPWTALTQVQLQQQLYNQRIFTGLKAAKTSVAYYELMDKVSEENVIQQVAVAYYQVLITRDKLTVLERNLEQVAGLEQIVQGQYENGLARKVDLDRIKVNKSNLETQKLEMGNAMTQQENLLKYYMGMSIAEPITLAAAPDAGAGRLAAAEANAPTSSLFTYQVLEKQRELLDLQRKAQNAAAYPSLTLGANYTYNTQNQDLNLYTDRALNYDASAVSLTLSIPLFDGNARRSQVKQTDIETLKVREELRKTDNGLRMDQENARRQMQVSRETIGTQEQNMQLAEEVFQGTQENYRQGLASLTDFLNAETELATAQNSYHEALLNYELAHIALMKANGGIHALLAH